METEKDLGQALLNQRSPVEIQRTDTERAKVMDTIGQEERNIRILKHALVVYWGLVALAVVACAIWHTTPADFLNRDAVTGLDSVLHIVVWVITLSVFLAVWVTIILAAVIFLKSRHVSNLQVQAKLLDIQEELRKLGEAKRREG